MMYLQVFGGFILLLGGAEIMVRGAIGLAKRLGISPLVIGMTVVAFGTSAPELLVSLNGALSGSPGIAIGNVIGSNIANILLILGIAGMITPIACAGTGLVRDGVVLLGGSVLFAALTFLGKIDLAAGVILIVFFAGFLVYSYRREAMSGGTETGFAEESGAATKGLGRTLVYLAAGFAGLIYGSEILVDGAIAIARGFAISEAVIGLTVIAFGTSLPELAACAVAAYRRHTDVALGNVVGSNIFNVVGIMGVVSVITPIEVPARVIAFDIWIMVAATLLLMPFLLTPRKYFGRLEAGLFVALYLAYIAALGAGVSGFTGS